MKTTIMILAALLAVAFLAVTPAVAEPPFSTVLSLNTTNATADFELAEAMQPENLRLWGVLPLSPTPQTVNVYRVHSDQADLLHAFVLASNVSSGSAVLTNAAWILLEDDVRISGPTNAYLEIDGPR